MSNKIVDMIVEIPYKSDVKYEIDNELNMMRCDRILNTAMNYPGNYGYIPNTLAGDGDPLDILLISDYQIFPGTIIKTRIVGVLITEDEKGMDEKIIAVPDSKVDPNYLEINNITDLSKHTLYKIRHFFNHYKDIERNKWVKVKGFGDSEKAVEIYEKSKI